MITIILVNATMPVWRNWQHARDLKSLDGYIVPVQVRLPAPINAVGSPTAFRYMLTISRFYYKSIHGAQPWCKPQRAT